MNAINGIPSNSFTPQSSKVQSGGSQSDETSGQDQGQVPTDNSDAVVVNIKSSIRSEGEAFKVAGGLGKRLSSGFIGQQESNVRPSAMKLIA